MHDGEIVEFPDLDIAEHRIFGDVIPVQTDDVAVGIQRFNQPLARCTVVGLMDQPEVTRTRGLRLLQGRHRPQRRRQRSAEASIRCHDEFHDIGKQRRRLIIVAQHDFRPRRERGEIDDHIKTLGRRQAEAVERQRRIDQAAVGPDQVEGDHLPGVGRILQSQIIDAGR